MTTVAIAQIECLPGDLSGNLGLHLAAIAEARDRAVDLLVFPELSLSDYVSEPDLSAVGMAPDDPVFAALGTLAGSMTLCVGFVERSAAGHHIATVTIAEGRATHVHRKVNLATYGHLVEGRHYAPGDAIELHDTCGWRSATLICADVWNPALPWLAALKGAELAIVPIASSLGAVEGEFENPAGWDATLRQIALTYAMPVILANHCGSRGSLRFWGGSRILDPYGRELARAGARPEMIVAKLDRAEMLVAREHLPTIRDADPALVGRLLNDILASGASEPAPHRPLLARTGAE